MGAGASTAHRSCKDSDGCGTPGEEGEPLVPSEGLLSKAAGRAEWRKLGRLLWLVSGVALVGGVTLVLVTTAVISSVANHGGGGSAAAAAAGAASEPGGCRNSDAQLLAGAYDIPSYLPGSPWTLALPPMPAVRSRITTSSAEAQRLFDQGLMLAFGFNHYEAARNLRAALRHDSECVMCNWALAYVLGPNLNRPQSHDDCVAARAALDSAHAAIARASRGGAQLRLLELGLVAALDARYPPADRLGECTDPQLQQARNGAYASRMAELVSAHPYEGDARALWAQALMDLSPWDYFVPAATQARRPPMAQLRPTAAEAHHQLQRVLSAPTPNADSTQGRYHPLGLHLLVHLTEASAEAAQGEAAAEALLAGKAGGGNAHLVHMAAHCFVNIGRYADAIRANSQASAVDEAYSARCLQPYSPGHQLSQLQAAALFLGKEALALSLASTGRTLDPAAQSSRMQGVLPIPRPLVRTRFGRWSEVLGADAAEDEPFMAAIDEQPFSGALWRYARALALAHSGRRAEAEAEAARLSARVAQIPPTPAGEYGALAGPTEPCHRHLGSLMNWTVAAALELTAPHARPAAARAAAAAHLRAATALQDALPYMEPEHWPLPVRLCLAAVLLASGESAQAYDEYTEDLRQHPHSPWALAGLRAAAAAERARVTRRPLDPPTILEAGEGALGWERGPRDRRLQGTCCELGLC